jgi:hypothetical protein
MTELLVNYGEKITYNVVDAAAMALKGQTEEDLSVVAFLLQRGGNIDAVRRALSSCTDAKTSEKILNRLEGKPVASDAEPVVMPAQQEPETPLPETCVKYERKVDDLTVVEIYDFNDRERMTVLRKANGDVQGAPLRESFNTLGRDHRGLKRAIDDFVAKGGVYDCQVIATVRIVEQNKPVL